MIGFVVGRLLWQGTLVPLKCPVVPVSAIAVKRFMGGEEACCDI